MTRVILLLLLICSFGLLHAQGEFDVQKDFDVADKELPERYYNFFYGGDFVKDSYFIETPALPFSNGYILSMYSEVPITDTPLPGYREIAFLYASDQGISKAIRISPLAREHVSFTTICQIILKVSATRMYILESTNEPIYYTFTRYYAYLNDGKFRAIQELDDLQLRLVRNFIYAFYGYDFTSPDLKKFFSQFPSYKPLYKNVDHLLQPADKEVIAEIQKEEAGFHIYKALSAPNLSQEFTAKGKVLSSNLARFFFPQENVASDDEYTAIMPALPANGGFVLGLARSRKASDSTFARSHSFVFFKSGMAGQPIVFPVDPMKAAIVYPTVKILHDHFVRIGVPPGTTNNTVDLELGTKRNFSYAYGVGYLVISGNDLFKVTNTPKSEIAYHVNYLHARYGLKFDTSALVTEFSKFKWYKPVNDLNAVQGNFTQDDFQIRTQLKRDDW